MKGSNIDGGWAWIVLISAFMIHLISYGFAWSTGVYYVVFLEAFQQPKSVTAWAGALPTAMCYAIGPISSMLTNKYGLRPVIMLGGVIAAVGLSLSYFAPSLYFLFFTFGALAGAGIGIAYIPSITAISYYFKERLNVAAGIAVSGIGVGNFIYPGLIRFLVNTYEWKSSLLILGAITLNICVFGALIQPIDRPDAYQRKQPIIDISPFKKKGYVSLCFNNFLWCCGTSVLYIHLTALAESEGIDPDNSAFLISGLGIANLIGRFGFGLIAHHPRVNVIILYGTAFLIGGIFICVTPFCKSFISLMFVAILFGVFSGCFGTLLVSILIQILGLHRFANGYGCLLLFEAAGQLLGGPLAGVMFDLSHSYSLSFSLGGALCIASAIIMVHPYFYVRKHLQDTVLDIPEKEGLASSTDFSETQYPSIINISKMAISLELIPSVQKLSSLDNIKTVNKVGSLDILPASKRLIQLRSFQSTASV